MPSKQESSDIDPVAANVQELRRGTVAVACLALLRSADHGYRLIDGLTAAGFEVEGNTLYPLLRRLEAQGLLASEWDTSGSRPRKFYVTTPSGVSTLDALLAEWQALDRSIQALSSNTTDPERTDR